ncbi:MAG: hypothetical protein PUE13_04640, partial [Clostridiales bacterium]|nr:hypothetical protein [Clostridiales bacterium]
ILTTSVESSTDMQFFTEYESFRLVDIMDGSIYEIPENMIEKQGEGVYLIKDIPVKDTPLMLVFGDFLK